jgi:hypothetical protein
MNNIQKSLDKQITEFNKIYVFYPTQYDPNILNTIKTHIINGRQQTNMYYDIQKLHEWNQYCKTNVLFSLDIAQILLYDNIKKLYHQIYENETALSKPMSGKPMSGKPMSGKPMPGKPETILKHRPTPKPSQNINKSVNVSYYANNHITRFINEHAGRVLYKKNNRRYIKCDPDKGIPLYGLVSQYTNAPVSIPSISPSPASHCAVRMPEEYIKPLNRKKISDLFGC